MVKPKKKFGQHFLKDETICEKVASVIEATNCNTILEIGAGTGALSTWLWKRFSNKNVVLYDVDEESIAFLVDNYPEEKNNIFQKDFLDPESLDNLESPIAVIGNFPYNISSQIVFKILENRTIIPEWAGMFQKEVAKRIAQSEGDKQYGILSVLTQAYYKVGYLFTIPPGVFNPPPKVDSGVLKAIRYRDELPGLDYQFFKEVVKMAFNQRRKKLSNSLSTYGINKITWEQNEFANLRPEQLSVEGFIQLAKFVKHNKHDNRSNR